MSTKFSIFLPWGQTIGKIEDWNPSYYSDFKAFFGNFSYTNIDANVHKINFQSI